MDEQQQLEDNMGFWNDHRYRGADRGRFDKDAFDEKAMTLTIEIPIDPCAGCEDDPCDDQCHKPEHMELTVPARFEICGTCEGKGKHVSPGIDDGGLTWEDFDADPGFRADYMRGRYDVTCYECGGRRVVPVVADNLAVDEEMKKKVEMYREYEEDRLRDEADDRATIAGEMGWR